MASFTAKYRSNLPCPVCGLHIEVGQGMTWTRRGDRRVYHADCYAKQYGGSYSNTTSASTSTGTAAAVQTVQVPEVQADSKAAALVALIQELAGKSVDRATVDNLINGRLEPFKTSVNSEMAQKFAAMEARIQAQKQEIVVKLESADYSEERNMGIQHKNFEQLLNTCKAHLNSMASERKTPINVWLPGPAGAGKTHAAEAVAKALGLPFYSCGAIMEPFELLGFIGPNGLVRTAFREAFEHGGVFLQDEVDGSSANALLKFNQATANGHCPFPDGMIARHPKCIIIAAANTFGLGGTSDYVGRVKLDAATLSRYVFIKWDYDEELERELSGNRKWADRVISIRHKAQKLGLKLLITPRATYVGSVLLASGFPQTEVEEMTIKQGMTEEQWNQVKVGA